MILRTYMGIKPTRDIAYQQTSCPASRVSQDLEQWGKIKLCMVCLKLNANQLSYCIGIVRRQSHVKTTSAALLQHQHQQQQTIIHDDCGQRGNKPMNN